MSAADPHDGPGATPAPTGTPYAVPPGYVGDAYPQGYSPPPGTPLQPGMPGPLYLEPPTSALAISSLILGIGGFTFIPFIGSIAAIICGHMARNEIRVGQGRLRGDGLALAGLILGYIGIALMAFLFIGFFAVVLLTSPIRHFASP